MGQTAGARRSNSILEKLGLTVSSLALIAGLPPAALAQEAAAQDEPIQSEDEIVVTGLRAGLESIGDSAAYARADSTRAAMPQSAEPIDVA